MLHVQHPLTGKMPKNPFDIPIQMVNICLRYPVQRFTGTQFLYQMEYRPEQLSKRLMFQQILVLKQSDQKAPFVHQKQFQVIQINVPAIHLQIGGIKKGQGS